MCEHAGSNMCLTLERSSRAGRLLGDDVGQPRRLTAPPPRSHLKRPASGVNRSIGPWSDRLSSSSPSCLLQHLQTLVSSNNHTVIKCRRCWRLGLSSRWKGDGEREALILWMGRAWFSPMRIIPVNDRGNHTTEETPAKFKVWNLFQTNPTII